jgi:phage tail-like protein
MTATPAPHPVGEIAFTVEIPGFTIGRFSECTGLAVEYEVFEYQEGGQNDFVHRLRGRVRYPNVVLKRGLTEEQGLLEWFARTQDVAERPTVVVTLRAPDARAVRRWACTGAFPVKWTGPSLNAGSNGVATEQLEIAHRGFLPTR